MKRTVSTAGCARQTLRAGALLTVTCLSAGFSPGEAADAAAAESLSVADRLERAHTFYAEHRLIEARDAYLRVLESDSAQFTALHRLSRVESTLGEEAEGEDQRRLVAASVAHARAAVAVAPDSGAGHLELAVALGRQALKEGPKTRLAMAREVKAEVDRAIEIDPSVALAYHVRGSWHRKISSLNFFERIAARTVLGGIPKGASMEQAVRDFEHAVELAPEYVNHRLELGRTYAQLDRWEDARRELQMALDLPPGGSPLDAQYKQQARALLDSIRDKGR